MYLKGNLIYKRSLYGDRSLRVLCFKRRRLLFKISEISKRDSVKVFRRVICYK